MAGNDRTSSGLHGSVLDDLGASITSGALPPGHVLSTDRLEGRYGVSRSVIREAIRVLESMGLVSSRRRVGVTVAARAAWHLFDPRIIRWRLAGPDRDELLLSLGELRRGVEPVAAALAARNATPEQCGTLTGAVMRMAVHGKAGELEAYLEADIAFHRTVLEASGNEMLAALTDVVAEVLAGRTRHHLMPARPEPAAIRWHAEVAQAVQAGDPEAAERAMRDIVREATQAMLTPPEPPPAR
ncbi:FadR/GntR family transcriptional regulator [Sphaerisporangium sp. TRM90804]|uniref:FadR/GntR family transcriptional regulator n=1 Tax=Sphaerisporangium sp. TRM90804 TaxID=3031113 RepID=UPI00244C8ECB|nr:FadR/GntR family transcriptional regulator [Sphaerisporangium sp. TRM90804]MDH2425878.1 FadR/GntR family transcriptional regulator [Sphaerisporangium sp. TRM90804]